MSIPLRVLIVEDSEDDALLLVRNLRSGGYDPTFKRVDTAEGMGVALEQEMWNIVIADYSMPRFSAPAALDLLKKNRLDLPFILVSGAIGALICGAIWASWKALFVGWLLAFTAVWILLFWDHRRLMWHFEEQLDYDLDRDGHVGQPPDDPADWFGVNDGQARLPKLRVDEEKRAAFLRFVQLADSRQRSGLATGQKAMRGLPLGFGYSVEDALHKEFVAVLVGQGLATQSGNGWRLTATPDEVRATVTALP